MIKDNEEETMKRYHRAYDMETEYKLSYTLHKQEYIL